VNIFWSNRFRSATIVLLLNLWACACLSAQQNSPSSAQSSEQSGNATESLQKATQNPVANLISVPLQDNTNFGIGPFDRNQNILNIQPVVPFHISHDMSLAISVVLTSCSRSWGETSSAFRRHRSSRINSRAIRWLKSSWSSRARLVRSRSCAKIMRPLKSCKVDSYNLRSVTSMHVPMYPQNAPFDSNRGTPLSTTHP
jgi:hypothetical protein